MRDKNPKTLKAFKIYFLVNFGITGHSPGFFSVRTLPPNQAITAAAQLALNNRFRQSPPPRDVSALIVKKSRSLLRHHARPDPSLTPRHRIWTGRAESPCPLEENSVALVLTSPPFLDDLPSKKRGGAFLLIGFMALGGFVVERGFIAEGRV